MVWKQSACQLFVIMINEGDHHDLCSKILAHRINLLGQAHSREDDEIMAQISGRNGFIAALDRSGGSGRIGWLSSVAPRRTVR